ncbi:MAG TPA: GNAT family protein [bacterium]|nr:GNAT family protein [bacterium]
MAKEKNIVLCRSSRLYLSPVKLEYAEVMTRWYNDPQVYGHIRDMSTSITVQEQEAWIKALPGDPTQTEYALFYIPDGALIGMGGFKNISVEDHFGEIWRVIGETKYWGLGLGTELFQLLCLYGFESLGFKNILGEHYACNPASLASAKKAGAKFMGTRRQARLLNGQRWDIHYTDILPHELIKP